MTTIHHHPSPKRGAPDQHRELHLGTIRQADLRPEGKITDGQRRLYDKAGLLIAIAAGDAAQINMHRLAEMPRPVPVDSKAHEPFAIPHKVFEHLAVERRGACARVDLGGDTRKSKLGQAPSRVATARMVKA